jgi:hypothetical protein
MEIVVAIGLLGLVAGALTTVAGLGGGMLLVLVLSVVWDPHAALAVTAPALLLGNTHRLVLFRREVDRAVAWRFAAGAIPASFVAGLAAVALPEMVLSVLLLAVAGLAAARELGWITFRPTPAAIIPGGAVAGAVTATTGGGGLLLAPMLLAHGLRGEAFIATGAAASIAMHVGRIGAYGMGGLVHVETLGYSALLAVAILAGNLGGRRVRGLLSARATMGITWATLAVALVLAIAGLA